MTDIVVLRTDCRPDEKCIGCGREVGEAHWVLCYVGAMAHALANRKRSNDECMREQQ
jgi:hypothetical protein